MFSTGRAVTWECSQLLPNSHVMKIWNKKNIMLIELIKLYLQWIVWMPHDVPNRFTMELLKVKCVVWCNVSIKLRKLNKRKRLAHTKHTTHSQLRTQRSSGLCTKWRWRASPCQSTRQTNSVSALLLLQLSSTRQQPHCGGVSFIFKQTPTPPSVRTICEGRCTRRNLWCHKLEGSW